MRLDNRMIIRDPQGNDGHMPDAHAVSDALGSTWNGIAGKIELRWTPKVWLADVQAFPNLADRSVRLKVKLGNASGNAGRGMLKVGTLETEVVWTVDGGEGELVVPLGANARLWDEFDPYLHHLEVTLQSPAGTHSRKITFGLREVTWRGKDLLVNGREVNIRSTHFGLGGTEIENDWNFWLYPEEPASPAAQGVLVTGDWQASADRLREGGTVLFTPGPKDLDPTRSPPMRNVPVFWNIQMTVRPPKNPNPRFDAMLGLLCQAGHPALKTFPTDSFCDWQWTSIIHNVPSVNLTSAPPELSPIVSAIDDWNRNWRLGVIFECRVGKGRLLVSAIPLDKKDPVTKQLRQSLLAYAAGEPSLPIANLTPAQADALWRNGGADVKSPPARRFDPDQDDGTIPRAVD